MYFPSALINLSGGSCSEANGRRHGTQCSHTHVLCWASNLSNGSPILEMIEWRSSRSTADWLFCCSLDYPFRFWCGDIPADAVNRITYERQSHNWQGADR